MTDKMSKDITCRDMFRKSVTRRAIHPVSGYWIRYKKNGDCILQDLLFSIIFVFSLNSRHNQLKLLFSDNIPALLRRQ